ncbi:DUF2846 domain-containing protein [Porphyrobacter sp. ULC335]|uniref:DUF2846 domain-containing protein n=1 Tax=Porphyrobacter sp. ULC335 TaxID=2854260 RepID=UPI00221EB2E7|nr:DUF2846 domain-containing protein [Porphyrobacter sp. ULC335]UYV15271.1 DUF2846 domain-containing protein [Porphyrobacter sp. ULC335]
MKKLLAAAMIAATAPIALTAMAPAAFAEEKAEGELKIPPPPPGKGQILFYRTGGISGAALGCAVFDVGAEDKLSSLGSGKYFILVSDPGPRSFTVKSLETKDAITLEIEEGETQFVRCKIKTGFMSGRADIAPSTETEFRAKHKNPKLVDAEDMSEAVKATNYP